MSDHYQMRMKMHINGMNSKMDNATCAEIDMLCEMQ